MAIVLDSITPNPAPAIGGMTLTLHGSGFTDPSDVYMPVYGDMLDDVVVVSPTEITCTARATAPSGTVALKVYNSDHSDSSSYQTYEAIAFHLESISPIEGPEGTLVTITGTGFNDEAITVSFDGSDVVGTFVSDTEITAIAPTHIDGVVSVEASVDRGYSADNTLTDAFTYIPPPAIPSPLGRDGDYYSDMTDPHDPIVYGPRTDGVWGAPL